MTQRYLFVAGLVLLFAVPAVITAESLAAVSLPSSYSQDAKWLEAEYQPFLKAFNKGQAPSYDKEFTDFILPDPSAWFGQYFEIRQVQALVDEYEAKIAAWQKSEATIKTKIWPPGTHFQVHCKAHPPSAPGFPPRQNAYQPKQPIPIEQFEVEFEADKQGARGGRAMSSLVNMVWVDGAYRYVGGGACPFWSMPDRAQPKESQSFCSSNFGLGEQSARSFLASSSGRRRV
jgi:hypothetical protein